MRNGIILLATALICAAVLSAAPGSCADGDATYVAMIGDVGYPSLADAVAAASDGDTILMVADDASTELAFVGASVSIEGAGFSFAGTLLLLTDAEAAYTLTVEDLVFTAVDAVAVSESETPVAPGVAMTGCAFAGILELKGCSDISLDSCTVAGEGASALSGSGSLALSGCALSCGLSVSGFSGVSLTDCTLSSAEPVDVSASDGAAVTVAGCAFSGPLSLTGDLGTVSVSNCRFEGTGTDVTVDVSGSGLYLVLAASERTTVLLGGVTASLSEGTRATVTAADTPIVYIQGTASLSGDGSGLRVRTVGSVTISDYVGTVWFDRSDSQGVTAAWSSEEWTVDVSTVGMTIGGRTGDGAFTVHGSLTVSDRLEIGGALIVPESGTLTLAEDAVLDGEGVLNLGTVDVYGVLRCDVDNTSGTVTAHSTARISGSVTGNPVVYPVPAVVTTVLEAVAGEEFVLSLEPEEGTVITGIDGVAWLTLRGSEVSGIPDEAGTYYLSVTAESAEYTVTLQYRIVVSEAEAEGASWNLLVVGAVLVVAVIAVAAIGCVWIRKSRPQ